MPSLRARPLRHSACLFKSPATRPAAPNLLARLAKQQSIPPSGALAALAAANHAEVQRRAAAEKHASIAATAAEQRVERQKASRVTLARIVTSLHEAITGAAPAAKSTASRNGGWSLQLGEATLTFSGATEGSFDWGRWDAPAFEIDAAASLSLEIPPDGADYEGRSHSLWFGDIQEMGRFAWFETAFMVSALIPNRGRQDPFALDPGEQAAKAV